VRSLDTTVIVDEKGRVAYRDGFVTPYETLKEALALIGFKMGELNLVFAFTAGIFATVNPGGWAMLPSFVAYYLGSQEETYEERPSARRAVEGITLGLLITVGFLAVFGTAGIVISTSLRIVMRFMPLVALLVGALLLLLGLWLLTPTKNRLPFAVPAGERLFGG
jgi:cytochrome c biogenesis protein CcdA